MMPPRDLESMTIETMNERDELVLLRSLLRASDYGVLLSDPARRDQVCNRRFCEMFGLESLDILQTRPEYVREHLTLRLKDPDDFFQKLENVYADPHCTLEDQVEMVAPRFRLLQRYTAPVKSETGTVIGRLWTFTDITRAHRMQSKIRAQSSQLREQSRQLATALRAVSGRLGRMESTLELTQQQLLGSEKLSAVGLLAASVAHDIRNILTPIAIEVSLADDDNPEVRAESLQALRQQVDSLSLLTHRLMALARPAEAERVPADMTALVTRLLPLVRAQAALENVRIVVVAPPAPPQVTASETQMDQVLVNLILNAIEAMRPNGGGTLTLTLDGDGDTVRLRVADTGVGIAPVCRRRLFDPFFTTRPDGAGLGLFSCRRILEEHGGTITVRARRGGGTQFTLRLPALSAGEGGA